MELCRRVRKNIQGLFIIHGQHRVCQQGLALRRSHAWTTAKSGVCPWGVTLIELLVTLGIAAVLAVLAIPSFTDFLAKTRVSGRANEMMAILSLARSEAVRRGATVAVCKSQDSVSCTTSGDWGQAILVFSDVNKNGILDGTGGNADQLVRVLGAVSGVGSITGGSNFGNWIQYDPNGASKGNGGTANGTFTFPCAAGDLYKIIVNSSGRARIEKTSC